MKKREGKKENQKKREMHSLELEVMRKRPNEVPKERNKFSVLLVILTSKILKLYQKIQNL